MSAHFTTPTDEMLLLAETLGEVKTKTEKLEAEFSTQARPLEAATNALSAALSGIKALQFHVLDNNLGALSARVEEMRKAVDEQVGVIALELKRADETNAAKAGQDDEALRSEIAALQAQLGTLGAQFAAQLERVEFSAKEEAKKLQLIPGPAGAAGASLNPRGTFIDGETYNRLDVVSWLGSSYIAAVDGVTEKPSRNSNQWQVLASRGGGAAGGAADFGSLAGVAQINQGGTGQTTRAAGLNALLPDQAGATQYMLLTDGAGNVSWGAQPVAGLPSQTSNSGKLLTTDGTNASWSNAVTVSGNNATVTGTLTGNGNIVAGGNVICGSATNQSVSIAGGTANDGGNIIVYGSTHASDPNTGRIRIGTTAIALWDSNDFSVASGKGLKVLATTTSTTTSSGALVVSGGVGVAKTINAGSGSHIFGDSANTAQILVQRTTTDPSSVTLQAVASHAIINFTGDTGYTWGRIGSGGNEILRIYHAGLTSITAVAGGGLAVGGGLNVSATTASTSTSSGALVVSGGVGVAGNVWTGGQVNLAATSVEASTGINFGVANGASRDLVFFGDGTRGGMLRGYHDGSNIARLGFGFWASSGDTYTSVIDITGSATTSSQLVAIAGTASSTSTTSGALTVAGGMGVVGAVNAGTFYGLVDGVTAPGTESGYARIYVDSADGDLKVKFGDGTVKTIATDS